MARKTPPHNPRGFEKTTWNYRVLQLRHALGWSQAKLSKVMSANKWTIKRLETGEITRPSLPTIRVIKNLESAYADILKAYKKAPVRMSRLVKQTKGRVRLLPIEVHRPEDIESLGKVEANSEPLFFGRKTRRTMQQTGMSMQYKAFIRRRNQASTSALRKKVAAGWRPNRGNKQTQSGQSDDE